MRQLQAPDWKRRVISRYTGRPRQVFGIKLVPHEHTLTFAGAKPGERRPRQRCTTCPWVEPRKPVRTITSAYIRSVGLMADGGFSVMVGIDPAMTVRELPPLTNERDEVIGQVVKVTDIGDGIEIAARISDVPPDLVNVQKANYSIPNPVPELPRHERLNLKRKVKNLLSSTPKVPEQRQAPTVDDLLKLKRDTLVQYMVERGLPHNSKTNKQQMADALVQHWDEGEK